MGQDFVHLRVHSDRSLLTSMATPARLAEAAAHLRFPAMALTDTHYLIGAFTFAAVMRRTGCRPLIGLEIHVKSPAGGRFPVVLLAMNEDGYRNLVRLSGMAAFNGMADGEGVEFADMAAHSTGLVVLTGGPTGEAGVRVQLGDTERARGVLARLRELFSPERCFVELQYHPAAREKERPINRGLIALARELDLPLVVTNDVHMITPDDYSGVRVLRALATGQSWTQVQTHITPDHDLKSAEQMWAIWGRHLPEALHNTRRIADMVDFDLPAHPLHLPVFTPPSPYTVEGYLQHLCETGLEQYRHEGKLTAAWEVYRDRLTHELGVITRTGYAGYMLVVWDMVRYARQQGIPVGPGRGSVGGALTAWTLGLTEIDPLAHGLLFERFLNPERVTMPDIDIDFCRTRRGEILHYLARRYGHDHVAQIVTLGTFGSRQALRDVGRVMGFPLTEVDGLARWLPPPQRGRPVPLAEACRTVPQLRRCFQENPRIRQLFALAERIEGLVRHTSIHASGVVLSPEPLPGQVPLMPLREGRETTGVGQAVQYPLESLETAGLVKIDVLGLKALTVLDDALERIHRECGVKLDITALPESDPVTLDLFCRGELAGVFQFEGEEISALSRRLAPRHRHDIAALGALYRPGPLDSGLVEDYLARREGRQAVNYPFPELAPILDQTHGVPVYQEQIMAIFQVLAGYSPGEADVIRRAMGKKQRDVLEGHRSRFLERAMARGHARPALEALWRQLEGFADYAFNKCLAGEMELLTSRGPCRVDQLARWYAGCPDWQVELLSWDGTRAVWNVLTDIVPAGRQVVWEVELENGGRLVATPEHRFLALEPDGRPAFLPLQQIAAHGCRLLSPSLDVVPPSPF
jgi:DNA polymerase-3 subunit alpha